jgi:hypothetical protein
MGGAMDGLDPRRSNEKLYIEIVDCSPTPKKRPDREETIARLQAVEVTPYDAPNLYARLNTCIFFDELERIEELICVLERRQRRQRERENIPRAWPDDL